jgi:hypothetical protein
MQLTEEQRQRLLDDGFVPSSSGTQLTEEQRQRAESSLTGSRLAAGEDIPAGQPQFGATKLGSDLQSNVINALSNIGSGGLIPNPFNPESVKKSAQENMQAVQGIASRASDISLLPEQAPSVEQVGNASVDALKSFLDVPGMIGGVGNIVEAATTPQGRQQLGEGVASMFDIGERTEQGDVLGILADMATPTKGVLKNVGRFGKIAGSKIGKTAKNIAKGTFELTTGGKGKALDEAFDIANKNDTDGLTAFRKGFDNPQDLENVAQAVIDGLADLVEERRLTAEANVAKFKFKDPDNPIDLESVQKLVLSRAESPRFGITAGKKVDLFGPDGEVIISTTQRTPGAFKNKKAIDTSDFPSLMDAERSAVADVIAKVMQQTDNSPVAVQKLMHQVQSKIDEIQPLTRGKQSQSLLTDIRKILRKELGDKVEGYEKFAQDFIEQTEVVEQMLATVRAGKGGKTSDAAIEGLTGGLFGDTFTGKKRREALEELEKRTGEKLGAQAAGLSLSQGLLQTGPSRLLQQRSFAGGLALVPLLGGPSTMLLAIPLTSPRIMGKIAVQLGAISAKSRRAFEASVQKLIDDIPAEEMARGIDFGSAISRFGERIELKTVRDDTLTTIGGIGR